METQTAPATVTVTTRENIIWPSQYSQRRCTLCTQYHGTEDCNPRMIAHLLRTS